MIQESGLDERINRQLQVCINKSKRVVLAFSGGLDSCVLLQILVSGEFGQNLMVWHINHGLLDCAGEMERFCKNQAEKYNVKFRVSHLNLDPGQSNLEAKARLARYEEFRSRLTAADILLTAHHADDQAETFFLNLLRGSGSSGLRGIARSKSMGQTQVLRPLLDISRDTLERYANQVSLEWFEDPSNQSDRFDRNYLRHQVLPLLKRRWPGYLSSIMRTSQIQNETQQLLDEVGEADFKLCRISPFCLCQRELVNLSIPRQKNVIRFWLGKSRVGNLPGRRLDELIHQLSAARQAQPIIQTGEYDIRIYNRRIYLVPLQKLPMLDSTYQFGADGKLEIRSLSLFLSRSDILKRFNIVDRNQSVIVKFRQSGLPEPASKHRLKRLFQKYQIPPWLRDQTPQIYIDGDLKGLWLD